MTRTWRWKKILPLLLLGLAAGRLGAKVYYINKGVLYHIGDGKYDSSADGDVVGTYPVVGQEWIQAFTVDRTDKVKVRVEILKGVDDCNYCKDMIYIDDIPMARFFAEDNGKVFNTPEPTDLVLQPGKVHTLKIASLGYVAADDFLIGNVVVETDQSDLTLMQPGPIVKNPGDPMPRVYAPPAPPSSPCGNLPINRNWLLGWKDGQAAPLELGDEQGFKPSAVVELKPGQAVEVEFQAGHFVDKDAVSQVIECLVGAEPYSGWALLFTGRGELRHGNLLLQGDYAAESLKTGSYRPGAPNDLRVERCTDGKLHALLNGVDLGRGLDSAEDAAAISFRARGMQLELKDTVTAR
jgi:hypothetical protein